MMPLKTNPFTLLLPLALAFLSLSCATLSDFSLERILDGTPPVVQITSPQDGEIVSVADINVKALAIDNARVASTTLSINDKIIAPAVRTENLEGGGQQLTIDEFVTLDQGLNHIILTAMDNAGNAGTSSLTITYDREPPTITIDAPSFTNRPVVRISGSVRDDEKVKSILFQVGDDTLTIEAQSEQINFVQPVELKEGINTINVVVIDQINNQRSQSLEIIMDTSPPTLDVDPIPGTVKESRLNMSITVGKDESKPMTDLETLITLNDSSPIKMAISKDDPSLLHQAQNRVSFVQSVELSEGANEIRIKVADKAGNSAQKEIEVILDSRGPDIILDPHPSITNQGEVRVGGTVVDQTSISLIKINGGDPFTVTEMGADERSFSSIIPLSEGLNKITVNARDGGGNETLEAITITRDSVPPSLTLQPLPPYLQESVIRLSGTAIDATGIAALTVNDEEVSPLGIGGEFDKSFELAGGLNRIVIAARDEAGNLTEKILETLFDVQEPEVVLDPVPEIVNTPLLELSGKVSDDGDIVSLLINGRPAVVVQESFSGEIRLSEGDNEITIKVVDVVGNEVILKTHTILDTEPPEIDLLPLPRRINKRSVHLEGVVSDNFALESLTVDDAPSVVSEGKFSEKIDLRKEKNEVVVTATDRAGNKKTLTVEIISDTRPPFVVLEPLPQFSDEASITLRGRVSDDGELAGLGIDHNGVARRVEKTGRELVLEETVTLKKGENVFSLNATDAAGNVSSSVSAVTFLRFSVAPLPFKNLGESEWDWVGEEAASVAAAKLAALRKLSLLAPVRVMEASQSILGDDVSGIDNIDDGLKVGRSLGVDYILMGSYTTDGNLLSLRDVVLVDVRSGDLESLGSYQGSINNSSSTLARVASAVLDRLGIAPEGGEADALARAGVGSIAARKDYLDALKAFRQFSFKGYLEAIRLFGEALVKKPDLAPAYAGLGEAYASLGFYNRQHDQDFDELYRDALESSTKAVELSPESHLSHRALALSLNNLGERERARESLKRALELKADDAQSLYIMAILQDDVLRSEDLLKEAIDLDPTLIAAYNDLGAIYHLKDDLDNEETIYLRGLEINADNETLHFNLGILYQELGRNSEALSEFETYLRIFPDAPDREEVESRIDQLRAST